jgi:hypothetical protein
VGAQGFVGKKLMKYLPNANGFDKNDFNVEMLKSADVKYCRRVIYEE